MNTIVIKVGEETAGGYPVSIHVDEDGSGWLSNPRETSFILSSLTPAGAAPSVGEAAALSALSAGVSPQKLVQVGQYLYRLLLGNPVGAAWAAARQVAAAPGQRATLTVLDIRPARLRALPWELLATLDPIPARLFLDPDHPFVRGRIPEAPGAATAQQWPLRALIAVGSAPDDEVIKDEEAREEVAMVLGALRKLGRTTEAEVLWRPLKRELLESYKRFRPHIFHFIGHAGPPPSGAVGGEPGDAEPPRTPYLKFSMQRGGQWVPWRWTIDDIKSDLPRQHPARLAVINACRAGQSVAPGHTLDITEAFADAGIPAVVGMLGDVKDEVAQEFAGGLYLSLAGGRPVDVALSEARLYVNQAFGVAQRHWALPSLSLIAHPDTILAVRPAIDPKRLKLFEQDDILSELSAFVDRVEQRRSLVNIDPYHEPESNKSLLIVRGESYVGKTALVHLFLECCAMCGRKILWVDMRKHGQSTFNFVQALCSISTGDPLSTTQLGKPLQPRTAFNEFHWELPFLLEGREPDPMPPRPAVHNPPKFEDQLLSGGKPEFVDRIFERFRQALLRVAGGEPLIIALDHFNVEKKEFMEYFFPKLLLPVKQHELSPVRMILVLSESDVGKYNFDVRESDFFVRDKIPLPKFVKDDFEHLAYEFFRYNDLSRDQARQVIESLKSYPWTQKEWTPDQLVEAWRQISG